MADSQVLSVSRPEEGWNILPLPKPLLRRSMPSRDSFSMIAQFILTSLLAGILLYAWTQHQRSPAVALLAGIVAASGIYFVWVPQHSTKLAELVGVGRGVDLILYIWLCISLILLLNFHLKLRMQMELVTALARKIALRESKAPF